MTHSSVLFVARASFAGFIFHDNAKLSVFVVNGKYFSMSLLDVFKD